MSAATFANHARRGPNPCATPHTAVLTSAYTCHMAVMHWAFMELGDNQATAYQRVFAINRAKCLGCQGGNAPHTSINYVWYGRHFCGNGAVRIPNRAALHAAVQLGDVLILPDPRAPMHSMVAVGKSKILGRTFVYIRGFNNVGTLGAGPHLAYDNTDRDIDKSRYWRPGPGGEVFGNGGAALHRIPYAAYLASATTVRNNCHLAAGNWTYTGP